MIQRWSQIGLLSYDNIEGVSHSTGVTRLWSDERQTFLAKTELRWIGLLQLQFEKTDELCIWTDRSVQWIETEMIDQLQLLWTES